MNGETEAWRKEMVTYLEELGFELMLSDMNAFPLTILVCSCLPFPSVISYRTSKINRALHLHLLSLLTHCP